MFRFLAGLHREEEQEQEARLEVEEREKEAQRAQEHLAAWQQDLRGKLADIQEREKGALSE